MGLRLTLGAVAFGLVAGAASAASTVFIDFTDRSVWSGGGNSGVPATSFVDYGVRSVTVTTNPVGLANFNQDFDGKNGPLAYCGTILACDSDGLGVRDDEITAENIVVTPPRESATLSFNKAVRIKELYFLDLFSNRPTDGGTSTVFEQANVYVDGDRSTEQMFAAVLPFQLDGGFLGVTGLNIKAVSSATFFASAFPNNDNVGRPDYALAGVLVQAVPLPASVLLFAGGLVGLGLLGRHKKVLAA